MAETPDKSNSLASRKFYFAYFDSITDFNTKGDQAYNEVIDMSGASGVRKWREYKKQNGNDFDSDEIEFYTTNDVALMNSGVFNEFVEPDTLTNAIGAFDEILADIDMGGAFNKSKLIITDNSMGIFDFGLASAGLFKVQEFYSEKLKKQFPFEFVSELPGIVPNLYVDQNQMGDFWYESKSGDKFQMTQQPKGTEAIAIKIPDATFEYRTNTKRSYLLFEKSGGEARYVDLYIGCGGLQNMTSSGMLARAMPVIMASQYFESRKIKTRINASRMYLDAYGASGDVVNFCWTIKNFGEGIDFTRLAVDTSDPRYFRWNNWANVSALMYKNYKINTEGNGSTIYGGDDMISTGNRYKNWYQEQVDKNLVPDLNIPKPLMIFGGLDDPPLEWKYTGEQDDPILLRIKEEFFRILDIVDFQYNDAGKTCKRIYTRLVDEEGMSISMFKRYITDTLSRAYSYPDRGEYSDSVEDQRAMDILYDEKIKQMSGFLQSLQTA